MKSQKERGFLTLQNRGKKPTGKMEHFLPQKFGHSFEHRNRDRFWSAFLTSQLEAKFEAAEAPVFQSVKRRAFLLLDYDLKVGRRTCTHSVHHFPGRILWCQTLWPWRPQKPQLIWPTIQRAKPPCEIACMKAFSSPDFATSPGSETKPAVAP